MSDDGMAGHSLGDLQQIRDLEADVRHSEARIAEVEGLLAAANTTNTELAEALRNAEYERDWRKTDWYDVWRRYKVAACECDILKSQQKVRDAKKALADEEKWLRLHHRMLYDAKHGLTDSNDDHGMMCKCPQCGEAHNYWIAGNGEADPWIRCEACYAFFRLSEMRAEPAPFRIEKPAPLDFEPGGTEFDPACMGIDPEEVALTTARDSARKAFALLDAIRPSEEDGSLAIPCAEDP